MGSPETLDFAALLSAIPGDSAGGADLRSDTSPLALYHKIKDARTQATTAERQLLVADPSEVASIRVDWRPVAQLVPDAIATKSKDLELVAWLIEALLRLKGFAGLRDGFRLARELIEGFWDQLYPMPDEDGIATRVAPLVGLNGEDRDGTLILPILNTSITQGSSGGPYACSHWQQANQLERIEDLTARQARVDRGAVSLQMFEVAVRETPPEFFRQINTDIEECLVEFGKMNEALANKAGRSAPPSSNIRNTLTTVQESLHAFAKSAFEVPEAEEATDAATDGQASAGGPGGGSGGAVRGREDAFKKLTDLAAFFRRTEPHSPVSYCLEQAVRWGRMPLPELLAELIPDNSARDYFSKLTGTGENKP